MVIAVCNQKGGTGKSTIAGFLATLRDSRLFGISSTCIEPSTPTKNAVKRESKRRSIFDLYYINYFLYYKIRCRDNTFPPSGPQCRAHWIYGHQVLPSV